MGKIITGKCKSCGFETEFSFGGNRSNYKTVCRLPAIDTETGEFVELNYYDYQNTKSKYLFYNDEKLKYNTAHDNTVIRNFNVELNTRKNFCPRCNSHALDFEIKFFTD